MTTQISVSLLCCATYFQVYFFGASIPLLLIRFIIITHDIILRTVGYYLYRCVLME